MSRRKQRSAFDQVSEFDRQSGVFAIRPLLGLYLTQNYRRLRHQWCDERRMWVAEWNKVVFTDESLIFLQHHDGWIRFWRHRGERMLSSCVMHRHTGPKPGTKIELLPLPARSPDLSQMGNMWSTVAQPLTPITPPAVTPDKLWQRVEAAWSAVPQEHILSLFESMSKRVAEFHTFHLHKANYCPPFVLDAVRQLSCLFKQSATHQRLQERRATRCEEVLPTTPPSALDTSPVAKSWKEKL
ncbi:transposable element Tcb1 transposase [Trichonephila clavipes]|nr:transposable element Tcb1 transposase [Trichonephila clavipes]